MNPDLISQPAAGHLSGSDVPRFVLDTNIWLDLFVFDDPAVQALGTGLRQGALIAVVRADTLEEYARVLSYAQFALPPEQQQAKKAMVRAFSRLWPQDSLFMGISEALPAGLPHCADPDDQKFLELARDARALALISKDKALLTLSKSRHRLPFRVAHPRELPDLLQSLKGILT
jgi:uncharacterized protein